MQLILLERVEGLGNVGDEVRVRPGYGRNFLLPKKKAVVANAANRKTFERQRQLLEDRQRDELSRAQQQAGKLAELKLGITRATSDGEHLYGSVTTTDLVELLHAAGYAIERRHIIVDDQIKTVGEHAFRVRLHPDVTADLTVKVESESA